VRIGVAAQSMARYDEDGGSEEKDAEQEANL
jgi:hypothetical protein